jgi:hypothetical protein
MKLCLITVRFEEEELREGAYDGLRREERNSAGGQSGTHTAMEFEFGLILVNK